MFLYPTHPTPGPAGAKGPQGPQGIQGLKGDRGPQGIPGPVNIANNLTTTNSNYALSANMGKYLNDILENLVFIEYFVKDNVTISAETTIFVPVTSEIVDGYSRFNHEVSIINATSEGVNSSYCYVYQTNMTNSDPVIDVGIRNTATKAAKIRVQIRVSYIKNMAVKK